MSDVLADGVKQGLKEPARAADRAGRTRSPYSAVARPAGLWETVTLRSCGRKSEAAPRGIVTRMGGDPQELREHSE
ncbi:hypothetical protein GCM10007874_31370 [Labrys miyagiensis]|uniref:Uncharacterized protein n=1 Tax=Labrys miyagiensis TaxID=346912 RepID=A0ABQ6CIX3_9HYPH|nr:hypothetical protein GCM10007874_31370 [Labrys miyagiensis]